MGLRDLLDRRRARGRLRRGSVALIHAREYAAPVVGGRALHDGQRGARALRRLIADGLIEPGLVTRPPAASWEELRLFHGADYLADCWRPERLGPIFGALPEELPIDALLDSARAAVGGTVLAAQLARRSAQVAVTLGGGFHHAEPSGGGGYCVFNDIGVAINSLRASGYLEPVAVVDLDLHHGNGTARGFERDESVLTLSFHRVPLVNIQKRANLDVELPAKMEDAEYLARLAEVLPQALRAHGARMVFYVAGADVIAGDAIGDLALTEEGAARRDQFVLQTAAACGARLVATLGGGYGEHAWRCAYRLARLALTGRVHLRELVDAGLAQMRDAARAIDPHLLSSENPDVGWELNEDELTAQLGPLRHRSPLFLNYYSRTGLELASEHYGLTEKLLKRGFSRLRVELDLRDPARQQLHVLADKNGGTHLIIEVVAGIREEPQSAIGGGKPLRLLALDWLSLQDPTQSFSPERPQLPLQRHPGLGIAWDVLAMLRLSCERLGLDGVAQTAAHYHVAALQSREALFFDPVREGKFRSLRRALADLRLAEATRLLEAGGVVEVPSFAKARWEGAMQVLPVSPRLRAHFAGAAYLEAVAEAERTSSYLLADPVAQGSLAPPEPAR